MRHAHRSTKLILTLAATLLAAAPCIANSGTSSNTTTSEKPASPATTPATSAPATSSAAPSAAPSAPASQVLCSPFMANQDAATPASPATPVPAARPENLSFFSLSADTSWQTPADISGGPGHFSVWTSNAELSYFRKDAANSFYAEVAYRNNNYRFAQTAPWFADTERVTALVFYERTLDKQWALVATAGGQLAAARDANLADGYAGFVGAGARFTTDFGLSFYGGIIIASRIMDSYEWLPLFGLEWQINKHWSLKTSAGITLAHDVYGDGTLRLELTGAYRSGSYLLSRGTDHTGTRRDYDLESRTGTISVRVTKEFFNRAAFIRAEAGASLYSKYRIRSHGIGIAQFETDPAATLRLEAGLRF